MTDTPGVPALVWFRQDLRLSDNPALAAALKRKSPVIPVYVWAPEEEGAWPPGAASRWWLNRSLADLRAALEQCGSRLIIRRGPTEEALTSLAKEARATAVFWNRRYEPAALARDSDVKSKLRTRGLLAESFNGSLLFEPWTIRNQSGQPFRVFTAFWRACLAKATPSPSKDAPKRLPALNAWPQSLDLAELGLKPAVDWAVGFREVWQPGESGARRQLKRFLDDAIAGYPVDRDRPGVCFPLPLSPKCQSRASQTLAACLPSQCWPLAVGQVAFLAGAGLLQYC